MHVLTIHNSPLKCPSPSQLPELARACIRNAKFPQLATIEEDQPRLRPVSPVRVDEATFTIYVANLKSYHKTAQIATNPKVELCMSYGKKPSLH